MRRSVIMIATILLSAFFIGAETVSLSGTVKKTGGAAGIAGVKVSLVKLPALSATTGADGSFSLTGSTASITSRIMAAEPVRCRQLPHVRRNNFIERRHAVGYHDMA